jgi:hypothetical protein
VFLILIIIILSTVASLIVAIKYSSEAQTKIVGFATQFASDYLDANVSIGKVDIEFFDSLNFEEIYLSDQNKDTLFYAKSLKTTFDLRNIRQGQLNIGTVAIEKSDFYLSYIDEKKETNLQFLLDVFAGGERDSLKPKKSISLDIDEVFLKEISFKYFKSSPDTNRHPHVINFNDIAISNFNLHIKDFSFVEDTVFGRIQEMSFQEKSGFSVVDLKTELKLYSKAIELKKLHLKTPDSDLVSDLYLKFEAWKDFEDFIEKVNIEADFRKSKLDFFDIAFFTKELQGISKAIDISGSYAGTIDNLRAKNVEIGFGDNSVLRGDVTLRGLPDIENTFFQLSINQLRTNKKDIETIPLPPFEDKKYLILPENFSYLKNINFKGSFTGFYYNFVAFGNMNTALGELFSDVALVLDEKSKAGYNGNLKTVNFDFGKFFDIPDLKNVTLAAKVVGEGFTKEDLNANIDGSIKNVEFRGYNYQNIELKGILAEKVFNGSANFKDPNLDFDFTGLIDLKEEIPKFKFFVDIVKADLKELNVFTKDSTSIISFNADIDIAGNNLDNLVGILNIRDLEYQHNRTKYKYEEVLLEAFYEGQGKKIILNSDIVDASISGIFALEKLPLTLEWLFYDVVKLENSEIENLKSIPANQILKYDFLIKDFTAINDVFVNFIDFAPQTTISGNINSNTSKINLDLKSTLFTVYGNNFNDFYLSALLEDNVFLLKTGAESLELTDSIALEKFNINTIIKSDNLKYTFNWNNLDDELKNSGNIKGEVFFTNLSVFTVKVDLFDVTIADSTWKMTDDNHVFIDNKEITFENFKFISDNQALSLEGKISEDAEEQFVISFENFELDNFNVLAKKANIEMQGRIDGEAIVADIYNNIFFSSTLNIDELILNGENLGSGTLNSMWDKSSQQIKLDGALMRGNLRTFAYKGYYLPTEKEDNINITIELARLRLDLFQNFVDNLVGNLNGIVSGNISITGSTSKPKIEADFKFQKASFLVKYLNVAYTFSGPVKLTKDKIILNDLALFDSRSNKAVVGGNISHNDFKDFKLNINVLTDKFMVLNTTQRQNDLYYGTAFMTGRIAVLGPLSNITINVNAKTERNTFFYIPLSGSQEVVQSNFITFINKEEKDSTDFLIDNESKLDLSGIILNFELDLTPDAEVQLIFDPTIGDIIKGRGTGHVKLEINSSGDFNMYGNYNIESGDYLFTLMNVINKRFKVDKGGSITWNGNPYNADIDLSAVYKLRTSLYDLGPAIDTSRKRVPVECVLRMTDDLLTPNINFDVRLPTSDEITKTKLNGIMLNAQERERQVFALLTLNRFVTPTDLQFASSQQEQVSHTGIGATSSTEFLSNQLSNWLSRISDDFDLGVKYRPGDDVSNEEFEVAVSTQIFNDRVVIDGNLGLQNQREAVAVVNNQNPNNLVGDFVVEYKISKDGRFRVKAFNQANNFNLINTNSPYTQGMGIFYRKEFNDFNDFIKNYFSSRQPSAVRLEEEDRKIFERNKKERQRQDEEKLKKLSEDATIKENE